MPGLAETPGAMSVPQEGLGFSVLHQEVELDIDFLSRSLTGRTTLSLNPHSKTLTKIRLNCRQCEIIDVTVNGKATSVEYSDTYRKLRPWSNSTAHHHYLIRDKIEPQRLNPPEKELVLGIPKEVRIDDVKLDYFAQGAQNALAASASGMARRDTYSGMVDSAVPLKTSDPSTPKFTPLTVCINYRITQVRDGLHFVGLEEGDGRYPHVYTRNSRFSGNACCLFPCVDDISSRCSWDIAIKCARTLGDVVKQTSSAVPNGSTAVTANGIGKGTTRSNEGDPLGLSAEDCDLEMTVVCSGEVTDEIMDTQDPTKKTVSFTVSASLAPQQIGFAIGPFEHINLAEFRETEEDEHLGQNAIPVYGFCLPSRADHVRNTCIPLAKAIDFFTTTYGSYPYANYKLCFVDDLTSDNLDTASLSICSSHLLFSEDLIDPLYNVTRKLVHALASQWVGVDIIPKETSDTWIVIGLAYFITDTFMKKLCGNNEYRFQQKIASDQCYEVDIGRLSLFDLGRALVLDVTELEFMELKAPLVLFILDRRLAKASGSSGMSRIVNRVFLNAKTGDLPNSAISMTYFTRTCEKLGHTKLDTFFGQWIYGAGCPRFMVTQRFNKKKLVVEMIIKQAQVDRPTTRNLKSDDFMRKAKEEADGIEAPLIQTVFTGPMTIRIHEADGTPYEHIVEIKESTTKFEIPYNTKYKRLKRSRRQKERAQLAAGNDGATEGQEDSLLYCLGDVLQSEAEIRDWQLSDWGKDDEDKMGQESYEWIRMDSDFEWICKMSITMPGYMYTSQLQQDRDVVAQLESLQYLSMQNPHPLVSTILVRTLMDKRYFYGIRLVAAETLAKHAKEQVNWIGLYHLEKAFQELFCFRDSHMTRSNDFSDRAAYHIQCAIPDIISKVKHNNKITPLRVKRFLFDKLKFNDNSNNEFSDCYYVSTLIRSLCRCLYPKRRQSHDDDVEFNADEEEERRLDQDCIAEIDRYRRIDEYTTSYQNIYSRTALTCQYILMKENVIDVDLMHFLQYTRPGTFDLLRVDAFRNLAKLDMFRQQATIPWFMVSLSSDPSPYVRESLFRIFGETLGSIAIGPEKEQSLPMGDGLVIEQDSSAELRANDIARKTTIAGAMEALKAELANNETFQSAIWKAVASPQISFDMLGDLVDICHNLYDPEYSVLLKLSLPRYWKAEVVGKGIVKFSKTEKIRVNKMGPKPKVFSVQEQHRSLKLKIGIGKKINNGVRVVSTPQLPSPPPLSASTPVRQIFKPPKRPLDRPYSPPGPDASSYFPYQDEPPAKRPALKLKLSMKGKVKDESS